MRKSRDWIGSACLAIPPNGSDQLVKIQVEIRAVESISAVWAEHLAVAIDHLAAAPVTDILRSLVLKPGFRLSLFRFRADCILHLSPLSK